MTVARLGAYPLRPRPVRRRREQIDLWITVSSPIGREEAHLEVDLSSRSTATAAASDPVPARTVCGRLHPRAGATGEFAVGVVGGRDVTGQRHDPGVDGDTITGDRGHQCRPDMNIDNPEPP